MRNRLRKQALCILLALSLVMGFMPVTSFAGWEDGEECEFCGRYRFDDWLCDCGPHCSESSATDDCFLENHCAECLEAVANSDRCDTCYICPDCMYDGVVLHCALCGACDEGGFDICEDCDLCMNCQIEAGTHCFDCGDCLESGSQCPDHPFEMYQENHCESCALKCSGCEDKCFLGETFIDIYCEEHELCVVCATDEGLHCKECYGCYEDELCSECQKCDECGLESGEHCPECDAHGEDWCETGGEGTHCVECASEYLCEQCDVCTSCSGTEFCDECGLCIECCRENAESENCSCGEYCIDSGNWEDHFCADCGACFDENEQCETCEYCVECCASQSECEDSMCIEDTDYDEHFCEECHSCFHAVEACESCQDAGVSLCTECCASLTEDYGCSHEYCTSSWQWDEHYCDICGKCYEDVDCTHDATAHIHTYDVNGNCTVCGYNKDGKPVITKQPKSVTANPKDTAAVYTVEAMGENLTYQWYYINLSTGKPVAMTDGAAYKGTKTKSLMVTVADGMCSLGKPVQIFCVVKNLNGNVTTSTVNFLVAHQYDKYTTDKTYHWYSCENCDKIKDKTEHRFNAWTILKQASQTENGLKRRVCYDCNYADTVIIPKLPADHVHDYSAAFVKTDTFHWTKCACGNENKGAMEEHNFGNGWITTIQPTLTSVGEETRTCGTCGYVETKEIEKQGHTHEFYNEEYLENHKDNGNYGYLLHNGYIVNLYSEPYGKKSNNYHYAYCVVDGCDAYERHTHKWSTTWYDVPTETSDGSYERTCDDCFYSTGLKALSAGKYRINTKNCTANIQAAAPGSTVKISLYKDYPAGYYVNFNESDPNACIDVNYTWGNGATGTWAIIEEEYHAPDEKNPKGYWTFTMPDLPTDKNTDWLKFYVEVEVELLDCTEDNHGDGRGLEWRNQREATCGKTGYTGDYMCKWCNYIEERGHDTPATGEHGELIAEPDYVGDCDHAGYTGAKRCSVCDEIVVPREYHGKTHKVTKVDGTYIAATCTSKGQSSQYACGRCGIVLTKSKPIAKLPHDWETVKGTATCTEGGTLDHVKCKSCGNVSLDGGATIVRNTYKLNTGLLGHDYNQWQKVDSTIHQRICSRDASHIETAAHTWNSGEVTKAATCKAEGVKTYTCTASGCGATKTEAVAKLTTHNYNAATCTTPKTCKVCGVTEGSKLGHTYDSGTITTQPTCKAEGVKTYKCTGCGTTKTEAVAKLTSHNYNAATCTTPKTCKVCGATEGSKLGHNYDSGTITTQPTCKSEGVKTYKCTVCGATKTEAVAKLTTHNYDSGTITAQPTCKAEGVKTYKCTVCGTTKTEAVAKLTTHRYDSGTITTQPTCKAEGVKTYKCTACGEAKTEAVAKKAHSYDSGTITTQPTCKAEGVKTYKCTACGEAKTEAVAKIAHSYAEKLTPATTTKNGSIKSVCATCGDVASSKTIYKASGVKLSYSTKVYTGKMMSPKVYVKDSKGNTISSKYYTISKPSGRKNTGKYTYTIKFKGNYSGKKTLTLTINPKAPTLTTPAAGSKAVTVKWKKGLKSQVTGYEVRVATNSKFTKNVKKATVTKYSTVSKKMTKLKAKTKYYVQVRAYKTVKVNGTNVKIYSAWSGYKTCKTR